MTEHNDEPRAWNCAWSRDTITHDPALPGEPPRVWVCVRMPDGRRLVTDAECRDCPFWERREEPASSMW